MKILAEDFQDYGGRLIEALGEYAKGQPGWQIEPNNYEGIRVRFDKGEGDGWFLLRLSLHDPIIPLNIESNTQGGVKQIAGKLYPFVAAYEQLDSACLKEEVQG